jgi:hypothetical protein
MTNQLLTKKNLLRKGIVHKDLKQRLCRVCGSDKDVKLYVPFGLVCKECVRNGRKK